MYRSFVAAIISALIITYLDPFSTGKLVQFAMKNYNHGYHWFELIPFTLIGILGGIAGVIFIKLNIMMISYRKTNRWLRLHPILDITIIILITSIINFSNLYMRGSSSALLSLLFGRCDDVSVVDEYDMNAGNDSIVNALCK
jgi:chloride channel 3/4/5